MRSHVGVRICHQVFALYQRIQFLTHDGSVRHSLREFLSHSRADLPFEGSEAFALLGTGPRKLSRCGDACEAPDCNPLCLAGSPAAPSSVSMPCELRALFLALLVP